MRRYKITYFLAQAFKGLWRNGMMTLASVTVLLSCLIVMGCFSMLVMNINTNLSSLGDLNEIVAFVYSDVTYTENTEIELAPAPSGEENTFLGWSTDPDATEAAYPAGGRYTVKGADAVGGVVTLYAVWAEPNTESAVRVRYHANGVALSGALPSDSASYEVDGTVTLLNAVSAKNTSIEFLGWSTDPAATEPSLQPGDTLTLAAESVHGGYVTLYAVWSKPATVASYRIVYDANRVTVADMPSDASVRLNTVRSQINRLDNIATGGIRFVSKEEALKEEMENYKDYPGLLASYESMIREMGNPLPDSFVITYEDNNKVAVLQLQLEHIEYVDNVRCRADIAENIEGLKNGIVLVFSWFMVILFAVSIFVIINTVKLAVVHRSKEITIMRYIGATKWFIALPFELEGIFIGLLSGGLAFSLQWYAYGYVQKMILNGIPMIDIIPFAEIRTVMLIGCLVVGMITGLTGSVIAIRKYLKA